MALKIRLRRHGRTNRSFYRLIVTDSRSPRDGGYIESVGWYNPIEHKEELHLLVKEDRVQHWLDRGAQLSEKAEHLVKQVAPSIVKELHEKRAAKATKLRIKGKERRKKAKA